MSCVWIYFEEPTQTMWGLGSLVNGQGFANWIAYAVKRDWFTWLSTKDDASGTLDLSPSRLIKLTSGLNRLTSGSTGQTAWNSSISGLLETKDDYFQSFSSHEDDFTLLKKSQRFIATNDIALGKILGSGASGRVYEGMYGTTRVAIKICHVPFGADAYANQKIMNEVVLLLSSQNHPNVVRLYGVCCFPEGFGFVMERCGTCLQTKLREWEDGQVTFRTVREGMLTWMLQIAEGLASLHAHNVLHLDLKPANVLLSGESPHMTAKICDFGLSRLSSANTQPMSYMGCGTPAFMALELMTPEMDAQALSTKVDVWALGVTFWSMIELRQPLEAIAGDVVAHMNLFYIANLIRRGDRLVISCPDCPQRLRLLVESCWQSDAANRPTARDCAEILKSILTATECED